MTQPPDRFTPALWAAIKGINAAIREHPFLNELAAGTLAREAFSFYILQDSLYLGEFAKVLAVLASQTPDAKSNALLCRHAADAIAVEQALHDGLMKELGLHPEQARSAGFAPTNLAYTSYLLATSRGRPFHEGLAAVLPCYWIYQDVGKWLKPKSSPEPLYRRWIDTYGGEEYDKAVAEVLGLADGVARGLPADQRSAMRERFVAASRYEWMFWDMAYRREKWPV